MPTWLLALILASGAPILSGRATADYQLEQSLLLPSYSNSGFSQQAAPGSVRIAVSLDGELSRTPWPTPIERPELTSLVAANRVDDAELAALALASAEGAKTRAEAVNRWLLGLRQRVVYDRGALQIEDASQALRSGRAACVGLANLAIAGLAQLGIPARGVRGLWVDPEDPGRREAHRWIEVHYPDAGWVFSDPSRSVNFVDTSYLLLRRPGRLEQDYDPGSIVTSSIRPSGRTGALLVVDRHPLDAPLALRRNHSQQFSGTIAGVYAGGRSGLVVELSGDSGRWRTTLDRYRGFSFSHLAPGRYTVRVVEAGEPVVSAVELEGSGLRTLVLGAPVSP